nr:hypothetical protein [Tanacetum cinerariifolium]
AAYLQTQLLIAQKEEAGIQVQVEEYDLMAATADLDEIEEVNANCILMANLQQSSISGTQTDSTPVYDTDRSAETKDLHTANYTQLYDFLKYNQNEEQADCSTWMNMGQDRQMHMVEGNDGNQFRQYAWQNAGNLAGYNDIIRNQVIQNVVQNPRVQIVGNQNGLIGVPGNGNQTGNGNLVVARAEEIQLGKMETR